MCHGQWAAKISGSSHVTTKIHGKYVAFFSGPAQKIASNLLFVDTVMGDIAHKKATGCVPGQSLGSPHLTQKSQLRWSKTAVQKLDQTAVIPDFICVIHVSELSPCCNCFSPLADVVPDLVENLS
jgi:hypothetical protein